MACIVKASVERKTMLRTILVWIHHVGIIELFSIYFLVMNLFTFLLYGIDKYRAMKDKWRIRESSLIFFTLFCGGIGAWLAMRVFRHKKNKLKFRICIGLGLIIALIPIIHIVHGFTLDRTIRYTEITFQAENWPERQNGYRIAFMTDFHKISDAQMAEIVNELNEREIDLLLLGGDFATRNAHYQGTLREIARVSTTDGIFGVEGNHDNYQGLFAAMQYHGIGILDNSSVQIGEGFIIAGVRDLWNGNADVAAAVYGVNPDDFILLVSHHPDVSMQQSTVGIDLILAGHTHGGQITLFGFPMYLLLGTISDYGTRFAYGFAQSADGVPVFTSSGVGDYYNWPRIFARPEVVIFTMYHTR